MQQINIHLAVQNIAILVTFLESLINGCVMREKKVVNLGKQIVDRVARLNINSVDRILEIGCGLFPQNIIKPNTHVCCEPYHEYRDLLARKESESSRLTILAADWKRAVELVTPGTIDSVFLIDVVEHLEKEESLALLALTENLVKEQIIVFTPLGFMPQTHHDGIDAWGLKGGSWQEHKSGWTPEDFGDDWKFYICDRYHYYDHDGVRFEEPYGAMWAIYTKPGIKKSAAVRIKRAGRFAPRLLAELYLWVKGCAYAAYRNVFKSQR